MNAKILTITMILLMLLLGAGGAEVYKWVDQNGATYFSDQPPRNTGSVGKVESVPTPHYQAPKPNHSDDDKLGRSNDRPDEFQKEEEERTSRPPEVELYTTRWCGYCMKAREYFRAEGIPFTEYDIERDQNAALRKKRLDPQPGIPFAVVNGQAVHGFSPSAYARALAATP